MGREGRPGIARRLCVNPRAQVGHIPDKVLIIQQVTTFGSAERGGRRVGNDNSTQSYGGGGGGGVEK